MDLTTPGVLTIGVSGSSSSGKTTLCASLSSVLPSCLSRTGTRLLFLHCDAYGKDFADLPKAASGGLDADSRDSVEFAEIHGAIDHIRHTAQLPEDYPRHEFIENDLRRAQQQLDPAFVTNVLLSLDRASIDWGAFSAIAVIDGFLLYHDPALRSKLDLKLLMRTSKEEAKQRRFGRYGKNAAVEDSEEFWKTRSYFEDCVWPNYVKEHAFIFPNRDVEATVDVDELETRWSIHTPQKIDMSIEQTMTWAVGVLLTKMVRQPKR